MRRVDLLLLPIVVLAILLLMRMTATQMLYMLGAAAFVVALAVFAEWRCSDD